MKFSVRRRDSSDPETGVPALSWTGRSRQWAGLMPPLCKPSGSFCPPGVGQNWVDPCQPRAQICPTKADPQPIRRTPPQGQGCSLHCAVPSSEPSPQSSVPSQKRCCSRQEPRWQRLAWAPQACCPISGVGGHMSAGGWSHRDMVSTPVSFLEVAQGMGFHCPPHALARARCPKTMGALSNGRAPLGFASQFP